MIKKLYYWLHKRISPADERGEYSSGYWQDAVRTTALGLCVSPQGRLLEIGCGEGLFTQRLAQMHPGMEIFSADIRHKIILQAKERLLQKGIRNVRLVQADSARLPFKNGSFAAAACINMFYNLVSETLVFYALDEISRVLKTGGTAIFDIRNALNPFLRLKYRLAPYYDATLTDHPLKTHRLDKIIANLGNHKLSVTGLRYIGFPKGKFAPIILVTAKKA